MVTELDQILSLCSICCGYDLDTGAAAGRGISGYDVKVLFWDLKAERDFLSLCLFWEVV